MIKIDLLLISIILHEHRILPYLHYPTFYQLRFHNPVHKFKILQLKCGDWLLAQIARSHVMGHDFDVRLDIAIALGAFDWVPIMKSGFMDFLAEYKNIVLCTLVALRLLRGATTALLAAVLGARLTRPQVIMDTWFDILFDSADYATCIS
jgi:hypothetical protein